jgi:hypothetical protein
MNLDSLFLLGVVSAFLWGMVLGLASARWTCRRERLHKERLRFHEGYRVGFTKAHRQMIEGVTTDEL